MATNEARKRELDELIEEERRTFLTIEPEEPRDSGGASGSGGPVWEYTRTDGSCGS